MAMPDGRRAQSDEQRQSRVPWITRLYRSRPDSSVPNQWASDGA